MAFCSGGPWLGSKQEGQLHFLLSICLFILLVIHSIYVLSIYLSVRPSIHLYVFMYLCIYLVGTSYVSGTQLVAPLSMVTPHLLPWYVRLTTVVHVGGSHNLYTCVSICTFIYIYKYIYTHKRLSMYVYICLSILYICPSIYIYIYTHM
jgi:hypothetical protein